MSVSNGLGNAGDFIAGMRTFVMVSMLVASFGAAGATLTVANFDEDLATVYVNGVAATNGQQIAVEGEVKLELKDFKSDYYFRYAPESYVDRTLGFESWEGVPAGFENANPATFTVAADLTVTPNVDVKGYAYLYDAEAKTASNDSHVWNCATPVDSMRTIVFSGLSQLVCETTENNLIVDCVERVRCNGKNYTITSVSSLANSRAGTLVLAPRFNTIPDRWSNAANCCVTNMVGMAELITATVGSYSFFYSGIRDEGDASLWVPRRASSISWSAYPSRSGITGELVLETVRTIGAGAFSSCTGFTAVRLISPNLQTIGSDAFIDGRFGEVTIGSSVLTAVGYTAFPVGVTNFIFLAAAPSQAVAGNIVYMFPTEAEKTTRFTVDGTRADWWALAKAPTADEIAAGLPENCMGILESVSGRRNAYIVSNIPLDGFLIEKDMASPGNEGSSIHSNLAAGDRIALVAPSGRDCCELQHLINGVWTTFETKTVAAFEYIHDGQPTRVVWRKNGAVALVTSSTAYGGTVSVELKEGTQIAENTYSKGSEVWVTAVGASERPRSAVSRWTGVPAGQETNETVKLVLNEDTAINALFRSVEWLYNPSTKKITDGEYTSDARGANLIGDDGMSFDNFTGGMDNELWLDFSLPIYNPDDPGKDYWIAAVTYEGRTSSHWKRVRFGPHIVSMRGMFWQNLSLCEVEHLGAVQVEEIANFFLYTYGRLRPLMNQVYEAEDFVPAYTKRFGGLAFTCGPQLVGTMRLGLTNIVDGCLSGLNIAAVTNVMFLAEDVSVLNDPGSFRYHSNIQSLTFCSTNLTSCLYYMFQKPSGKDWPVREVCFNADAPAAAALDNILYSATTTNTIIYCSKRAPGWRELRAAGFTEMDEWAERPAGAWGIYQTADGKKRFYLVQRNGKYDNQCGLKIFVR